MKIVLTRDEIKKIVADRFNLSVDEFILQISAELATSPQHSIESIVTVDNTTGVVEDIKRISPAEEAEKKASIAESAAEFKKYFNKDKKEAEKKVDIPLNDKKKNSELATRVKKKLNGEIDKRTQPRIDYRAVANEIERFLASNINEIDLPTENRTASGIHRRYQAAAEQFGLIDKIRFIEKRKDNRCILVRK